MQPTLNILRVPVTEQWLLHLLLQPYRRRARAKPIDHRPRAMEHEPREALYMNLLARFLHDDDRRAARPPETLQRLLVVGNSRHLAARPTLNMEARQTKFDVRS